MTSLAPERRRAITQGGTLRLIRRFCASIVAVALVTVGVASAAGADELTETAVGTAYTAEDAYWMIDDAVREYFAEGGGSRSTDPLEGVRQQLEPVVEEILAVTGQTVDAVVAAAVDQAQNPPVYAGGVGTAGHCAAAIAVESIGGAAGGAVIGWMGGPGGSGAGAAAGFVGGTIAGIVTCILLFMIPPAP